MYIILTGYTQISIVNTRNFDSFKVILYILDNCRNGHMCNLSVQIEFGWGAVPINVKGVSGITAHISCQIEKHFPLFLK